MKLYEILGVEPTASEQDVKKAYKKAAWHCHPDRHPEKEQKFKELNEAYQVLSDPSRRAHYDATGDIASSEEKLNNQAVGRMMGAFFSVVSQITDPDRIDVVEHTRNTLLGSMRELQQDSQKIPHVLGRMAKVRGRLRGNNPILYQALNNQEETLRNQQGRIIQELKVFEKAVELLSTYSYQTLMRGNPYGPTTGPTTSTSSVFGWTGR